MELELGLKLTRAADDFTSDFQLSKDRAGPVFLSRETDDMFTLTAHLKGYKREHIKIDINEDGTVIAISGERHVKETVMVGWKVYNEGTTIKEFKKAFKIPGGVILDEIKANYNEDESTLKITMPKKVKGIVGTKIEEADEKHELSREGSLNLKIADEQEHCPNTGASDQENNDKVNKLPLEERVVESFEKRPEREEQVEKAASIQETSVRKQEVHEYHSKAHDDDDEDGVVEEERLDEEKEGPSLEPENNGDQTPREKSCKLCIPIVAGSTLLLSLVVFVFQMIRSKNQNIRRRD
ncbi:HSP20-like chaperones superfamily protein [Striga hermonthica]|uniref:HSP20-like chaperones superfamily protein n=1 Tax=Striga hermonthica TaxID=68872 RepID=A0A9N7R5T8_STRHE|nr:HSP20-like chaperones superfamily protein [Striga hermonthica]